tara:strand:- start:3261 stop:4697 length:1437 start_codon:yes stop_codon:yes gene_type:complete
MSRILIFYPDKLVKKHYHKNKDIIFFNNDGWSIFNDDKRYSYPINQINVEKSLSINIQLIDEIRTWGPLFSRMLSKGDQQELILRKIMLLIERVIKDLRKYKIGDVIFMTGASHHIDSMIFDLACSHLRIDKIFLYREVIDGRLVPLLQPNNISSRSFLNLKISAFKYENSIKQFLNNKIMGKTPLSNDHIPLRKNIIKAILITLFNDFKFILKNFKNFAFTKKRLDFDFIYQTYPFYQCIQLTQAFQANRFYKKNVMDSKYFLKNYGNKNSKNIALIIAAHLQPEATSFPEGGKYSNHVDIVISIRNKGYKGPIFYKEHSASFHYLQDRDHIGTGIFRSVDYYKELLSLGCIFLDEDFHFSINKNKNKFYVPITIGGSLALERSLAGFQTIVCGYPWYHPLPGTILLDKIKSLKSISKNMSAQSNKLQKDTFNYLKSNLSEKTIYNNSGIGASKIELDKNIQENYINEFNNLINSIK